MIESYQYPLKMDISLKEKINDLAKKDKRSFNKTILFILDKFLKESKKDE